MSIKFAFSAAIVGSLATLACTDATAMARKRIDEPVVVPEAASSVSSGTFEDGLWLGHRNGDIIVARLKARTIESEGCSAIGKLEDAIIKVNASLRRPSGGEDLVRGFYKGYVDSIREAIRAVRFDCSIRAYETGQFAGNFYGSIFCSAGIPLELDSLYSGWSGGEYDTIDSCLTSAWAWTDNCGLETSVVSSVCAD